MTKADIHNAITTSPLVQAVTKISEKQETDSLKLYSYQVLIGDNTTANSSTVEFYVYQEATPEEAAYWRPGQQAQLQPADTSFETAIIARANTLKNNGNIKTYQISELDNINKVCTVTVYRTVNGQLQKQTWLAYADQNNALQFERL